LFRDPANLILIDPAIRDHNDNDFRSDIESNRFSLCFAVRSTCYGWLHKLAATIAA